MTMQQFLSGNRGMGILPGWGWATPEERSRRGQHPPCLMFWVKGDDGVIVCQLTTNWYPMGGSPGTPYFQIAYHQELSESTAHADDMNICDHCEFLDGRACVGHVTGLTDLKFEEFIISGPDYIFSELDRLYINFKDAVS